MEQKKDFITSNTAETDVISRAEYDALKAELAKSRAELAQNQAELSQSQEELSQSQAELAQKQAELSKSQEELAKKRAELAQKQEEADRYLQQLTAANLQNDFLLEQLRLKVKKIFGRSSEASQDPVMEQLSLFFNEAEATDAESLVPEQAGTKVKAYTRKRRCGSIEDVIPEGLPVKKVEHRLSEEERVCPECGEIMEEIGKEVRRTLKIVPAQYSIIEDITYTYSCNRCKKETGEATIVKAAHEPAVMPGSFASAEAIAYIMTQKYVMHSPLYRLQQEMESAGIQLSRQTMSNWMMHASKDWLLPVYERMRLYLRQEDILHGDETTLQVIKEPGKSAVSKSYMWLYRTGRYAAKQIVLYEYCPNRKPENAECFLGSFHGYLHTDGYQGYHTLKNVRIVGCFAHARRKFDEALNALSKDEREGSPAAVGAAYITRLFLLEREYESLPPEERREKRLEQAKPVLDELLAWAKRTDPKTAPKSALGKALKYLLNQWTYLLGYLEDGRLELSNNRAERSIKPFVIGRKNWLFANTPGGAQASAVIFSIVETAKATGLDPYRYLLHIMKTAPSLDHAKHDWPEVLLPWNAPTSCKLPVPGASC